MKKLLFFVLALLVLFTSLAFAGGVTLSATYENGKDATVVLGPKNPAIDVTKGNVHLSAVHSAGAQQIEFIFEPEMPNGKIKKESMVVSDHEGQRFTCRKEWYGKNNDQVRIIVNLKKSPFACTLFQNWIVKGKGGLLRIRVNGEKIDAYTIKIVRK